MGRAYLIYNPAAGRFPSWLLTDRAAGILRAGGWEIQIEQTQSGEHITELAREAAAREMDALFVVGGDGTINQAITGLMNTPTALGVLPAGTANVWAQELGLPGLTWTRWMALEESAKRLVDARPRPVDIGMCQGHPFLLWAGVGLDAFIVHRLEPRSRWVKYFAVGHYAASALWSASQWHGINLRVEVDGRQVSGRYLLAVVSNVHLYAGGYVGLSPNARLDDGQMDLWLFKGESLEDTAQMAWGLWSGNFMESDRVEHIPFRQLRFEANLPAYAQVDGEPLLINGEGKAPVEIQVLPKALNVLAPTQTPHPLFQ